MEQRKMSFPADSGHELINLTEGHLISVKAGNDNHWSRVRDG